MAYTDRTIRIAFDGTQVDPQTVLTETDGAGDEVPQLDDFGKPLHAHYPNLGEDIWIVERNPMLMPQSLLLPKNDIALDANGRPVDVQAALVSSAEVVARLIVDWHVYDVFDMSDDPQPLPVPATADMFDKIPAAIGDAVADLIKRARNPR